MKQKLGFFGILLLAAVFMILPFAVHADAAGTATVVYLSAAGTADGDGLTPETAVNSINVAYSLLDPTKDGTVVICGEFTQNGNFARASSAKSITLTSVYGGVDYRESGAVYKVNGNRFGLADDTTFENITFETAGGSFLLVAQHHAVTVGEGVEMRNFDGSTPGKAFWVVGGFQWNFGGCAGPKYMNTSKATNVTVLSGNDMIVVGGARDFSTVNGVKSSNACTYGDVNVHIGGTAQVSTLYAGAYAAAYTTVGNVNAEIFGNATVGNIYGAYVHNTTASNVTLLWVGGEVGAFSMAQTNGVGLKTASGGTVALEATEDVQATANYEAVAAKFTTTSTHTHSHDDVVVTREATCIEDGEMTYFCTGCSDSFTEPIPATGEHTYKSEVTKEATCVEAGEMTYTCTGCGDSYTEAIPATGEHTYTSEVTKEATCVEAGEMTHTCSVCGDSYTEPIPATGEHTYTSEVTKDATCGKVGVKTYTCTVCGATKTEDIPFEYPYHQWLPTDTGYTCAVCNTTADTLSAPTAMRVESVTVENGTATVVLSLESSAPFSALRFKLHVPEGFTYASHVTTLGDVTEDVDPSTLTDLAFAYGTDAMAVIYIKGQDLVSMPKTNFVTLTYTVADTFTAETATVVLEMVEAYNIALEELDVDGVGYVWSAPAHTHEYTSEVTKEATCGADGVRTYTCTCGDSYTEVIPATGEHTYTSEVTKEATCVEAGEMTHTCSVCGHSYTEPIPATGKHTFGEWVETTPAQPGVAGEETRTCTVCGATETRATDPLPEVPETYAAYIGDVGYATVQAAMDAAKALDTITVEADVVETVMPKTTVYLAGDYSGITVSGDYTLDVTGRYMRSGNAIVEDTIVKYTPAAVMAIVRPNAVTENSAILSKQTLVLKSSVEYKIQARKATVDAYEAFYAVIDLCSADGSDITSPTADAKARRLIITDKVLEGSTYIYVADGIPASCMGNTIRVTFYGINADGTVDYRTLSDNSIAAKLYEFGATGDAEMNLAAALLNYGAAAQTNFGYNTANLVNASLAAELQRSSLADYSDTVLNGTRAIDELVEGETAVFTATKITGELLDKIVLNITLRPADTANKDYSDLTFVCEYTDYLGAAQTVVIPSSEWNTSGSMPIVKLDRLSAANLRQKLTINIYSGYGTEAQSRVLKTHYLDGFEYTATTGQATSNPEALRVLYYSIMHYSDMAKAYLAQ